MQLTGEAVGRSLHENPLNALGTACWGGDGVSTPAPAPIAREERRAHGIHVSGFLSFIIYILKNRSLFGRDSKKTL